MNENGYFDHINDERPDNGQPGAEDNLTFAAAKEHAAQGESIVQDGQYGWQSVIPPKEEKQDHTNSNEGYTHMGAYAEASAKELTRAAKEARKNERQQRRAAKHRGKGGRQLLARILAVVLCGVLFGGATAGAFIGVMHLTGYADRFEHVLEAADKVEEITQRVENNISGGTTINSGISENDTDEQTVYKLALPSVVAITNTATYNYNFGFYSYEDEVKGSGSGIVIGKNETELLIVTNYHVIEGANSLTVTFVDGETVQAYTKGTAPDNDLAVVAVMLKDMKAETKAAITIASLGSEKEVEVGHKVVAIGNALGYGQVLTVGYVSAVNREVKIENKVLTLIQTDAAINPGNSGGALLNMNGEVIGINSAKYSDTNVEGMGFAIPISLVREIIDDLMTRETLIKVGKDEKGYIGVGLQTSSGSAYGMPNGAYVTTVIENGPAVNSGLLPGDIITKLEDISIATREDLLDALDYYKGGTTVNLTVQRRVDGTFQEMQIQVTLGYRKDYVKE